MLPKKIVQIFLLIAVQFIGITAAIGFYNPVLVSADNRASVCEGLSMTGGTCDEEKNADGTTKDRVSDTIADVINILSLLVGVVSVIMIIIGGFKYIISSGDANNTKSAKDTILYALIGLVIVALSQVIVKFVLNRIK